MIHPQEEGEHRESDQAHPRVTVRHPNATPGFNAATRGAYHPRGSHVAMAILGPLCPVCTVDCFNQLGIKALRHVLFATPTSSMKKMPETTCRNRPPRNRNRTDGLEHGRL